MGRLTACRAGRIFSNKGPSDMRTQRLFSGWCRFEWVEGRRRARLGLRTHQAVTPYSRGVTVGALTK